MIRFWLVGAVVQELYPADFDFGDVQAEEGVEHHALMSLIFCLVIVVVIVLFFINTLFSVDLYLHVMEVDPVKTAQIGIYLAEAHLQLLAYLLG